eukprot:TRINITY_DN768_c3_g1_i2.p1 TRINITY_DN768_c3_g1~~TRINITY_DN768_c3_g1_i2.p1  ORF type:complete len:676 (+),score=201.56 TRINITY_DN768_c3_g1_i2:78-2105(+)
MATGEGGAAPPAAGLPPPSLDCIDALGDITRLRRHLSALQQELNSARLCVCRDELTLGGTAKTAQNIRMQGWLKKKTPSSVVQRDYDRRWFVLAGDELRYYEERGAVAVGPQDAVSVVAADTSNISFELFTPQMHRKFELSAKTQVERDRWVAAIAGKQEYNPAERTLRVEGIVAAEGCEREALRAEETHQRDFMARWQRSEESLARRQAAAAALCVEKEREAEAAESAARDVADELRHAAQRREAELLELQQRAAAAAQRRAAATQAHASQLTRDREKAVLAMTFALWWRWLGVAQDGKRERELRVAERERAQAEQGVLAARRGIELRADARRAALRMALESEELAGRRGLELQWTEWRWDVAAADLSVRRGAELQRNVRRVGTLSAERDEALSELARCAEAVEEARLSQRQHADTVSLVRLAQAEAEERHRIASEAALLACECFNAALRPATAQRMGGRLLTCLDGWRATARPWRDVYVWADARRGLLHYSHRDPRFGEVESLSLDFVAAVEVEPFVDPAVPLPATPDGVPVARPSGRGFYLEMRDGRKHRFCAQTAHERLQWLDALRGLVITACYGTEAHSAAAAASPPRLQAVQGEGRQVSPPRYHWQQEHDDLEQRQLLVAAAAGYEAAYDDQEVVAPAGSVEGSARAPRALVADDDELVPGDYFVPVAY